VYVFSQIFISLEEILWNLVCMIGGRFYLKRLN
jgi:hypothetical protein